jgi:hypothetical protein
LSKYLSLDLILRDEQLVEFLEERMQALREAALEQKEGARETIDLTSFLIRSPLFLTLSD